MFNPEFSVFDDWMFGKLTKLLDGINPSKSIEHINLSLGEPQLEPPLILQKSIQQHSSDWKKYSPAGGTKSFREAVANYLLRRYPKTKKINDLDNLITPVPGTRAPLYQVGSMLRNSSLEKKYSLVTNPFYHAWRAGALASGNKIHWMNAVKEKNWLPDLKNIDQNILKQTSIMYLCTPSNPQGTSASLSWLVQAIETCRKHNILLCVDECYADIYRNFTNPPVGSLEAINEIDDGFSNVLIFHSLSKRSSAAGLRAGFILGDENIIRMYRKLIANGGVTVSLPQLKAAEALYNDDQHVIKTRDYYDRNFEISKNFLNAPIPNGGFFHFIEVNDDINAAKHLWKNYGIKTMPGSFMAQETKEGNPGRGYLRLALVHNAEVTQKALSRVSSGLEEIQCNI